jgi:DNA-binding beta-propeller fold protein YncE
MSQCAAGKRRIALASIIGLVLLITGCNAARLKELATEGAEEDTSSTKSYAPNFRNKDEPEVLKPSGIITGGQQVYTGSLGEIAKIVVGAEETVRFVQPVAVGGYENFLYVVDAQGPAVYRYDLDNKIIHVLGEAGSELAGEPMNIFVEPDLSFYIADPAGKRVLYFNRDGRLVRQFQDLKNLSRPVDVVVDEKTDSVLVADGTYSHIVVFNKLGTPLYAFGQRGTGPGRFRAITAMTKGPDSLYVTDRLELPVQELEMGVGISGRFRYSLGEGFLTWPTAIVVDKDQRVFVSDRSDNTIKVFDDIRLIATVGGSGAAPGRFRLITDMWLAKNGLLYVADSLNRRVQVFQVVSENEQGLDNRVINLP